MDFVYTIYIYTHNVVSLYLDYIHIIYIYIDTLIYIVYRCLYFHNYILSANMFQNELEFSQYFKNKTKQLS